MYGAHYGMLTFFDVKHNGKSQTLKRVILLCEVCLRK
jgi:hypothetical protein